MLEFRYHPTAGQKNFNFGKKNGTCHNSTSFISPLAKDYSYTCKYFSTLVHLVVKSRANIPSKGGCHQRAYILAVVER